VPRYDACFVGYVDVGYVSDSYMAISQTVYIFTIGNIAISWRSAKQILFVTSSNHSKLIALHKAIREYVWLRTVIEYTSELFSINDTPTTIHEDNVICIDQMKK